MDTRTKILTAAGAGALEPARPLLLVTGHFDILRADQARHLKEELERTQARSLAVVIRAVADERLPAAVRAEMAAALRVVDYVFIAGDEELDGLSASLQPIETIHLEESDVSLVRQLIEHVHSRQSG